MVLEKIHKCNDVRSIPARELPILADEIRSFLIEQVSENGGHLASNLGTVELTIALHRCLDLPNDRIVWDVGHQSYTHKILTGRKEDFSTLRTCGGLSGFPKRAESPCDCFDTGHSSTSISAGIGMVQARELLQEHYTVVSVIGDGSLTGGLAYEGLNNAASLNSNFIIILNDNAMSISKNVGGMSRYLAGMRTQRSYNDLKENVQETLKKIPGIGSGLAEGISRTKNTLKSIIVPGMMFEDMGITYLGPVDGHDLDALTQVINDAKNLNRAVLIHVRTQKGRGYAPAAQHPERFHGIGPFDVETGKPQASKNGITYTEEFSRTLCHLAADDPSIVGITAAMKDGTGLAEFARRYPKRFFDVGIAEEHAVTFAAGLAVSGLHPIVAVYSSFLQRAYDQILHDVCIQNLPVIFAIDRAGFVGDDGETHQGLFDLSYLRMLPNMTVIAPKNRYELRQAFSLAASMKTPVAVRYPKTIAWERAGHEEPFTLGHAEIMQQGDKAVMFALGTMVQIACEAADLLSAEGIDVTVVNLRFAKPLDRDCVLEQTKRHPLAVTLEENVLSGGVGEEIGSLLAEHSIHAAYHMIGVSDCFVRQGTIAQQRKTQAMDSRSVADTIRKLLKDREENA